MRPRSRPPATACPELLVFGGDVYSAHRESRAASPWFLGRGAGTTNAPSASPESPALRRSQRYPVPSLSLLGAPIGSHAWPCALSYLAHKRPVDCPSPARSLTRCAPPRASRSLCSLRRKKGALLRPSGIARLPPRDDARRVGGFGCPAWSQDRANRRGQGVAVRRGPIDGLARRGHRFVPRGPPT